jgi:hypothetical protein
VVFTQADSRAKSLLEANVWNRWKHEFNLASPTEGEKLQDPLDNLSIKDMHMRWAQSKLVGVRREAATDSAVCTSQLDTTYTLHARSYHGGGRGMVDDLEAGARGLKPTSILWPLALLIPLWAPCQHAPR